MAKSLLRFSWLLPCALLVVAACGGKSFEASGGEAGAGAVAGQSAAGAGSSGAGTAGSSSAGTSSGGASVAGSGGSAGLDMRACDENRDCQVLPSSCCSCGQGSVSSFTAINTRYVDEFQGRCALADCAGCPPTAAPLDNPVSYYVPTCRAGRCEVVDLRATQATTCMQDSDCRLRAGTGCCQTCGGGTTIALSSVGELVLQKLVCDATEVGCTLCAPTFDGYLSGCNNGQCAVEPNLCPPGAFCPNGG